MLLRNSNGSVENPDIRVKKTKKTIQRKTHMSKSNRIMRSKSNKKMK